MLLSIAHEVGRKMKDLSLMSIIIIRILWYVYAYNDLSFKSVNGYQHNFRTLVYYFVLFKTMLFLL